MEVDEGGACPHTRVGRPLAVLATHKQVRILDGNEVVATHPRSYDKGEQVEDESHVEELARTKRRARQHRGLDRLSRQVTNAQELLQVVAERGGNLGNVSALGSGLLMMYDLGLIKKLPRIVVAQAERANPLYRSFLENFEVFEPVHAQKTLASAIQIGNPVSFQKAVRTLRRFHGIVVDATERELADAAALGDTTGMLNCPHTGVALAALIKLLGAGKIDKAERVVVISTAHGLKFTDFKVSIRSIDGEVVLEVIFL